MTMSIVTNLRHRLHRWTVQRPNGATLLRRYRNELNSLLTAARRAEKATANRRDMADQVITRMTAVATRYRAYCAQPYPGVFRWLVQQFLLSSRLIDADLHAMHRLDAAVWRLENHVAELRRMRWTCTKGNHPVVCPPCEHRIAWHRMQAATAELPIILAVISGARKRSMSPAGVVTR